MDSQEQGSYSISPHAGILHRKPVGEPAHSPTHEDPNLETTPADHSILTAKTRSLNSNSIPWSHSTSPLPPDWVSSYTPNRRVDYNTTLNTNNTWTYPLQMKDGLTQRDVEQNAAIPNDFGIPEVSQTTTEFLSSLSPAVESLQWETSSPSAPHPGYQTRRQTFPSTFSETSYTLSHQLETGLDIGKQGTKKAIELSKMGLEIGLEGTKKAIELSRTGTEIAVKTAKEHKTTISFLLNLTNCLLRCFTGYSFGGAKVLGHTLEDNPVPRRQVKDEGREKNVQVVTREIGASKSTAVPLRATQIDSDTPKPVRRATGERARGTHILNSAKRTSSAPSTAANPTTNLCARKAQVIQQHRDVKPSEPEIDRRQSTIDSWLSKQGIKATLTPDSPPPAQNTTRTKIVSHIEHSGSQAKLDLPPRRQSAVVTVTTTNAKISKPLAPTFSTLEANPTVPTPNALPIKPSQHPAQSYAQTVAKPTVSTQQFSSHPQKQPSTWTKIADPLKTAAKDAVISTVKTQAQQEFNTRFGGNNPAPNPAPTPTPAPAPSPTGQLKFTNNNPVIPPNNNPNQKTDNFNIPSNDPTTQYGQTGQYAPTLNPPQQLGVNVCVADNPMMPNMMDIPDFNYDVGNDGLGFGNPDIVPIPDNYNDVQNPGLDFGNPSIVPIPGNDSDMGSNGANFDGPDVMPIPDTDAGVPGVELDNEGGMAPDESAYDEGEDIEQELAMDDGDMANPDNNLEEEDANLEAQDGVDNENTIDDDLIDGNAIQNPDLASDDSENFDDGMDNNLDDGFGDAGGDDTY